MKRWRAYRFQQNQACTPGNTLTCFSAPPSSHVISMWCKLTPVLFVCSLTVRPGGDEGPGRLERTSSLRLPGLEHGPLEASTPQGEDLPSPFGSQSSANMVLRLVYLFFIVYCVHVLTFCTFHRMTLATLRLHGVAPFPRWTASPQNELPSAPRFLLTSMPMRTACQSRAAQRASRMVRGHNQGN